MHAVRFNSSLTYSARSGTTLARGAAVKSGVLLSRGERALGPTSANLAETACQNCRKRTRVPGCRASGGRSDVNGEGNDNQGLTSGFALLPMLCRPRGFLSIR